ncbi:FAD/NAD(P)-binding protein [Nigerium massiliense]|uniref:FAD/NAD(P)-binding protein n=1 Tax=Nigerium massiliense TaxID=1522317 RepID=UPI00058F3E00|nr:FAD/NAD(P)-binding domain-containing protein [Nigerium massiliense]
MAGRSARGLDVAVIGCGPRGVYAVERLLAHAAASDRTHRLRIDAFDPAPPGAATLYHPHQPDYLRANVFSGDIDASYPYGAAPGGSGVGSFDDWRPRTGDDLAFDPYPPRSSVGRYLGAVWSSLRSQAPAGVTMEYHPKRVTSIRHERGRWHVEGSLYDEVLITTGHVSAWEDALKAIWQGRLPLVDAVYPVTVQLRERQIPPASSVAVRGAGLTFVDAVLALTEGRGGTFAPGGRPHRMRYRRSGRDIAVAYPFCRTGRFPEVKPSPDLIPASAGIEAVRDEQLTKVNAAEGDLRRMLAVAAETAGRYLQAGLRLAGDEVAASECESRLEETFDLLSRTSTENGVDSRAELERSIRVAFGSQPVGPQWALGRAWRDLYPAIRSQLTAASTSRAGWARFIEYAVQMEEVAFGLAPVNGVKLLALIEAGVIDPRSMVGGAWLDGDGVHWPDAMAMPEPRMDAVIDAVLPPPGVRGLRQELIDSLIEEGYLRPGAGRVGLDVRHDGRAIDVHGDDVPGLSCIGRPTEDVETGNDALLRLPADPAERWASRVVRERF